MDLKELQGQLSASFEELKKMGQRHETELKTFGDATQETKNSIANINAEMDKLKGQIDQLAVKANRMPGANGQPQMSEEQKARSEAFYKFVREGKQGLTADEKKALVEDATGQILVPEDLDDEIYRELPKLSVMRQLATVRTTGRDRIRRRSLTEVTVGWGKLEVHPTAKLGDFESTMVPSDEYLYIEDALGLTKIGEDELEDTDINLAALIQDSFTQAYAELEDTAFIAGTGHANYQPEGILTTAAVPKVNTGAVGTFSADDMIKLAYALPAQYRRNGKYLVNSAIELNMRLMKGTDGQYLWQPSLQAGTPNSFNGSAVFNQDDIAGTVTTGSAVAVFGDFKAGYRIYDRKGGSVQRLNELYIEDGLIGFKYKRRVGGGVVRPNALRILTVG